MPSPRQALLIPLTLALGIYVYGWFEARNIRVQALTIKTEKLLPKQDRFGSFRFPMSMSG